MNRRRRQGCQKAVRLDRRGGRQRPALDRPSRRSGEARRENAPSPGLARTEGPRALRCPLPRRKAGGRRAKERCASGHEAKASGRADRHQVEAWRREHETHAGARREEFGVQTSVRTHRRPRRPEDCESKPVDTRGLARTTHDSRGDARIGGEDERIGARVSQHAVHKMARRVSVERAKAAGGAIPLRSGSGDRDIPRAASAIDPEHDGRVLGAWTRPL